MLSATMTSRDIINLRSDTQTLPTPAMRTAMANAELGDDTYREDPTVRRLEDRVAGLAGVEAALLTVSGTMANLVAVMTHCRPGDELFLDASTHVLRAEAGGLSRVAGVLPSIVGGDRGHMLADLLAASVQPVDVIRARPRLVWLENTHNFAGGTVMPATAQSAVTAVARRHGLATHLDGARLPNAAAHLNQSWAATVGDVDSVYLDFSKGLGCPLGAVVAGSREFVDEARFHRQVLGGGMRQAGVIAACALVALDTMVDRLAEDHSAAGLLAAELSRSELVRVPRPPETNMVMVDVSRLSPAEHFADRLRDAGVLVTIRPPFTLRLVTHHDVGPRQVRQAADRLLRVAERMSIQRRSDAPRK
jgi:threonine aldolase